MMKKILILIVIIFSNYSYSCFSDEIHINKIKNMYPKCESKYKHNCFLDWNRGTEKFKLREVGLFKNNSIWEGYYFEKGELIYTYKQGILKSRKSCKKRGEWWVCHSRKYKKLDKLNNIYLIIWDSGETYEGGIKNSVKHGQGTYSFVNGSKYIGEFKEDKKHGYGIFIFKNGDKYRGQFVDNMRHGEGVYTFSNGDILEGMWDKNEFKFKKKINNFISPNPKFKKYKQFCNDIGFTPDTEKFANCVTKLIEKGFKN